jgi:hypothetical protein
MIPDFISIYLISLSYVQDSIMSPILITLTIYGVPLTIVFFSKADPLPIRIVVDFSCRKYTSASPALLHQVASVQPHLVPTVLIVFPQEIINIDYIVRRTRFI